MLRICIPVHNEATTIGVLLWRLRTVFQGFSREYDVVVYDDASTDSTTETLEPYRAVMPLTVLRGAKQLGYAGSVDALVRHVAADDEYARRDAMVLLQGDFTECPEHLPELVKRFEGGADLVAVDRAISNATPPEERRIRRWGPWAMKPFLSLPPVADPFTGFRLVRISVLRDLIRVMGNTPVCSGEGWAANVDFALNVAPFARRIENVTLTPRYDVRQRPSRRRGWPDVLALFHWARGAKRVRRPAPGAKTAEAPVRDRTADPNAPTVSAPRAPLTARAERPERPERDRYNRAEGGRPPRGDSRNGGRPGREERPARTERPERDEPKSAPPAPAAPAAAEKPERPPREPRPPRAERPPRRERPRADVAAPTASDGSAVEPEEAMSGVAETGDGGVTADGIDATAEPKRARRRRRRGRRDRESRPDGATDGENDLPTAGTSDDRQGEQEDNGGDSEPDDASEQSETGGTGDATRRKRRSRRRRRPRRPGEVGGASDDAAAPPSVEPPTA